MAAECIHGLDQALCDVCTPKPVPKAEVGAPKVVRRRAPVARPRVAGTAGASVARGDHRVYHVTHISNLEGILAAGALLSDSQHPQPRVDISSAGNREERRSVTVGERTVADFVPFFVNPDSAMWQGIRASMPDPRLASEVRAMAPAEFVVLVSTPDKAGSDCAVAVGDAADAGTRFATSRESAWRELGRLRADEELSASAEFLVHERVPVDAVTLIGVANDRARNEVRDVLGAAGFSTKVSIYPPWFARA